MSFALRSEAPHQASPRAPVHRQQYAVTFYRQLASGQYEMLYFSIVSMREHRGQDELHVAQSFISPVRRISGTGAVQAILALMERVKQDKKLPDGKRLYVKLGCRGDWPDLQEPGWQPPEMTPVV